MLKYISRRLSYTLLVLTLISLVVFLIFALLPADPAALTCGKSCNPQVIEANRHRLGLDVSVWQQWWRFIVGLFQGRTYGEAEALIKCPAPALVTHLIAMSVLQK